MVVEKVVNKTMKTYTTTQFEEWSEKLLDENSGMIKTFNNWKFLLRIQTLKLLNFLFKIKEWSDISEDEYLRLKAEGKLNDMKYKKITHHIQSKKRKKYKKCGDGHQNKVNNFQNFNN